MCAVQPCKRQKHKRGVSENDLKTHTHSILLLTNKLKDNIICVKKLRSIVRILQLFKVLKELMLSS